MSNHILMAHDVYTCACGKEFLKMGKRSALERYKRHQVSFGLTSLLAACKTQNLRDLLIEFFFLKTLQGCCQATNPSKRTTTCTCSGDGCEEIFTTKRGLQSHEGKCTLVKKQCPKCKRCFKNRLYLSRHKCTAIVIPTVSSTPTKKMALPVLI